MNTKAAARSREEEGDPTRNHWELRLYIAGQTPRSRAALANLENFCEDHLASRYSIEAMDLLEQPQLARGDQILAIPTLVRKLSKPMRKVIGDPSDTQRVLIGLNLRCADASE